MINLVNTKTKRRRENPKIKVLKVRSSLNCNLKIFFKNIFSSGHTISLLVVLITLPVETVI